MLGVGPRNGEAEQGVVGTKEVGKHSPRCQQRHQLGGAECHIDPRLLALSRGKCSRARPPVHDFQGLRKDEILHKLAVGIARQMRRAPLSAVTIDIRPDGHKGRQWSDPLGKRSQVH